MNFIFLENKIHIFAPPCNILYILTSLDFYNLKVDETQERIIYHPKGIKREDLIAKEYTSCLFY